MSTNTPPPKYGCTLPSLGGKGMGERQPTDWVYSHISGWCLDSNPLNHFDSEHYYCRPINPGPENELVGEDEIVSDWNTVEFTCDGLEWKTYQKNKWNGATVKAFCEGSHVIGVRRKVVKDEWPKYWEGSDFVRRALSPKDTGQFFTSKGWRSYAACEPIVSWIDKLTGSDIKPCTPQRAFELTGDKSILENQTCLAHGKKMSEHNCLEELRKAQKILEKQSQESTTKLRSCDTAACPECGASLHVGSGSVPIEKNTEQSPPKWIPVSKRLPEPNQPFVERFIIDDACEFIVKEKGVPNPSAFMGIWNFWFPLPPPPQPKTREQEDEEWVKKRIAGMVLNEANVSDSLLEAIAYARALDKAK